MRHIRPDVDVVMDVLLASVEQFPDSEFLNSLLQQYRMRGGLSKKQLQGLLGKAHRVPQLPPARLATLEAIIRKKVTRERSAASAPVITEDPAPEQLRIAHEILEKFPQHKRLLFFRAKLENREALTRMEVAELEKFYNLLITNKK